MASPNYPNYPIEQKDLIKLRIEFRQNMDNISTFVDSALSEKLFLREHKNSIKAKKNESEQIDLILDIVEKKLASKSDRFIKALLESDNDYLVKKLLPGGTNISDVWTHFNLDTKISYIKFEGKYKIEHFTKFRIDFVKYMSDMPTFIDHALGVNLLNIQHKNQIISLKNNADDEIREMCDIMERKLPEKSDEFLFCLIESGNDYLVGLLQPDEGSTLDFTNARKDPDVTTRSQETIDAGSCYPMKNRGRVVIIENVNFSDSEYNRDGSENDRKELDNFFSELNFEVIIRQDLTAEEMEEFLTEQIDNEKGCSEDCFILFILSHGRVEEIFGVNGETMKYSVIFDKFNKSPIWKEKPKLIYIQACQPFLKEEEIFEEPDAQKVSSQIYPGGHFYIMYATIPGEYAMRNTITGSRLIQSLIKVYKENYLTEDIESMGIKVKRLVYKIPESETLQIAVCYSCISKRIYIRP